MLLEQLYQVDEQRVDEVQYDVAPVDFGELGREFAEGGGGCWGACLGLVEHGLVGSFERAAERDAGVLPGRGDQGGR